MNRSVILNTSELSVHEASPIDEAAVGSLNHLWTQLTLYLLEVYARAWCFVCRRYLTGQRYCVIV